MARNSSRRSTRRSSAKLATSYCEEAAEPDETADACDSASDPDFNEDDAQPPAAKKTRRPRKNTRRTKCRECLEFFGTRELMLVHVKDKHPEEVKSYVSKKNTRRTKCRECLEFFETHELMLLHVKEKHPEEVKSYVSKCSKCPFEAPNFSARHKHQLEHRKEILGRGEVDCGSCDFRGNMYQIQDHRLQKHKLYTCIVCNTCHSDRGEHWQHTAEHRNAKTTPTSYQCETCGHQTIHYQSFLYHLTIHKKSYHCKTCKKMFYTRKQCQKHIDVVHQTFSWCPLCGKPGYKTRRVWRNHVKHIHGVDVSEINGVLKVREVPRKALRENSTKIRKEDPEARERFLRDFAANVGILTVPMDKEYEDDTPHVNENNFDSIFEAESPVAEEKMSDEDDSCEEFSMAHDDFEDHIPVEPLKNDPTIPESVEHSEDDDYVNEDIEDTNDSFPTDIVGEPEKSLDSIDNADLPIPVHIVDSTSYIKVEQEYDDSDSDDSLWLVEEQAATEESLTPKLYLAELDVLDRVPNVIKKIRQEPVKSVPFDDNLREEYLKFVDKVCHFKCEDCLDEKDGDHLKFESYLEMRSHFKEMHTGKGYAFCCGKKISHAGLLKHLKSHALSRKPTCGKCNASFRYRSVLKLHMIEVHHEMPKPEDEALMAQYDQYFTYRCEECPGVKELGSFSEMRDHFESVHQQLGYVFCCDQKFSRRFAKGHLGFHLAPDKYQCPKCQKVFLSSMSRGVHVRQCGSKARPVHKSIKYQNISKLDRFDMIFNFECEECHVRLSGYAEMKEHLKDTHGTDAVYAFTKDGRKIGEAKMDEHSELHALNGFHYCSLCDVAYSSIKTLYVHRQKFHGQKPNWNWNGKGVALDREERYNRIFQFRCESCPIKLNGYEEMRKHFRETHNSNGYAFVDTTKVPENDLGHYSELQAIDGFRYCSICDSPFTTPAALAKHKTVKHKDQTQDTVPSKKKRMSKSLKTSCVKCNLV